MKKLLSLMAISTCLNGYAFAGGSCEITVHEKTPDCYVTKDSDNCLVISNEKPKCDDKGQCVAKLPGCDETSHY